MSSTSGGTSRRGRSMPPDRLAAVLDEVDRARQTGGWMPDEPVDGRPRPRRSSPDAASGKRLRGRDEAGAEPRHLQTGSEEPVRPHTPLVRPPRSLQDAVVAPGRVAALAVLVLVIAAGAVLGGRVLWLRATSEPQPAPAPAAATSGALHGTPRPTPTASTGPTSTGPGARAGATRSSSIVVHVVGQVERPGVVTLKHGSRVREAIAAAGGARKGADVARLNLARPVADGEQVVVPKPGEDVTPAPGPAAVPGTGAGSAPSGGTAGQQGAPVNLNRADAGALEELPGVGPVLAGRIVQWRTDNGPFTAVDELGEVSGIGEKMLVQLRPLVTV